MHDFLRYGGCVGVKRAAGGMSMRLGVVRFAFLLAGSGACAGAGVGGSESSLVVPNDNRVAAGALRGETLSLRLVARRAEWRPAADSGPGIPVAAFAVEGEAPRIPGPLLRVTLGTRVRLAVRNELADTIVFCPMWRLACVPAEASRIAPGASIIREFVASRWGATMYRANFAHEDSSNHQLDSRQLVGALVVDSVGQSPIDRVLVINSWVAPGDTNRFVQTINGKMWPHTERFGVNVGDSLRWRLLNADLTEHPMHLHGFYFRVDSRGDVSGDTLFAASARPLAVTENLRARGVATITWAPSRGGRWLFHCHKTAHMSGQQHAYLAGRSEPDTTMHMDGADHMAKDMGGLVMGIDVTGDARADLPDAALERQPAQRFRLMISERDHYYRGKENALFYELDNTSSAASRPSPIPGPLLTLTRGEPVEIAVVNRIKSPSSVHWHGIELESFYDGVAGWSGVKGSFTPMIAPTDSFVARFTPLRSGTFMYHSHVKEQSQLTRGLYAPIVVLEPGQRFDPARDHVLLFSQEGPDELAQNVVNGKLPASPLVLAAGVPNRLRLINITAQDEVAGELTGPAGQVQWRVVAKDGADSPASVAVSAPARFHSGPGEIVDVELSVPRGRYSFKIVSYNNFEIPVIAR